MLTLERPVLLQLMRRTRSACCLKSRRNATAQEDQPEMVMCSGQSICWDSLVPALVIDFFSSPYTGLHRERNSLWCLHSKRLASRVRENVSPKFPMTPVQQWPGTARLRTEGGRVPTTTSFAVARTPSCMFGSCLEDRSCAPWPFEVTCSAGVWSSILVLTCAMRRQFPRTIDHDKKIRDDSAR